MDKEAISEGFKLFSAGEREALLDLMDGSVGLSQGLRALMLARRRDYAKALSDSETDRSRRLLVGARLPRETAERYRQCAREHGQSLYAFCSSALEREFKRWQ